MSHFIDLRTNGAADSSHGGFWPSFTDIMMVVVMIFMLASVVLILRNWDLVQELRNTVEAERLAAEMARNASETNATLEEQLAQTQYQLSELRMRNMQLNEENERQRDALNGKEQQLLQLGGKLNEAEGALQREMRQRIQLEEQIRQQQQRLSSISAQLGELEESHRAQADELIRYKQDSASQGQQLLALQGEYDSLKVKYDKLVRPARTAKGKYVVEVRYEKHDGKEFIRFKDKGDAELQVTSSAQMHQRLSALKQAHPGKLYIKIIIPSDSGLSYSEAWKFMKGILEKYDYYYQS